MVFSAEDRILRLLRVETRERVC